MLVEILVEMVCEKTWANAVASSRKGVTELAGGGFSVVAFPDRSGKLRRSSGKSGRSVVREVRVR